jgi:prepilin signal peptidase PulO-like enzyme (type II secretory pathway)
MATILCLILGVVVALCANFIAMEWDSSTYKKENNNGLTNRFKFMFNSYHSIGALLSGILFPFSMYHFGPNHELIASFFFICILLIIVQTDLSAMIIPNKVVAAGVVGALLIRVFVHPLPLWNYGVAAFVGSGALLVIGMLGSQLLKKETMGGGDIKLYVFIGLILGIKLTLLSLFLASLFGLIGGLALMAAGAHARGKVIPFGPYIAAGSLAAYYWGDGWIAWYVSLLV